MSDWTEVAEVAVSDGIARSSPVDLEYSRRPVGAYQQALNPSSDRLDFNF